jgi:tRNA/rRNA methyltransferase
MAASSRRREPLPRGPAIILVEPQLGENIGTAARAMLNCGLEDLRLVRPRDHWPNARAVAASAGADKVLSGARLFESTAQAVADLDHVYAATGRDRHMVRRIVTPRQAAREMHERIGRKLSVGVLFGPERTGLESDDLTLADVTLSIPLNPEFASLNLAQAVLVVGYEWWLLGDDTAPTRLVTHQSPPAPKKDLLGFFDQLEGELDACGFLRNAEKRPNMVRNIRNIFQRAELTVQEIQTLRGMVKEMTTLRVPGSRKKRGPAGR